jgi:hypothetical protein
MKPLLRALTLVFVATSGSAQDAAPLDQIVQTYVENKTLMGSVLVARGRRPQQGLRGRKPRMGHPEHAVDEVPARVDHEAIHGGVDSAARGAWQAEARGSDQGVPA